MYNFNDFIGGSQNELLAEGKEGKNLHLEHLEDNVLRLEGLNTHQKYCDEAKNEI